MSKTEISRRGLLKSAAGAVLAPTILMSSRGRAAPADRITMGCIGIGNMGSGNCNSFLNRPQIQMVAVCDVRSWVRDEWRNRVNGYYSQKTGATYDGCQAYHDYRDLLARDDIDAVMIATPDHWHALIAIEAAKAGKDIYCEKPLTLTVREADALETAVRRYGRVFQTGSQQRSSNEFWKACMLVRNGRIGKIQQVNVNVGDPSQVRYYPEEPIPDGFDWDRWLGPAPWAPHNGERCSGNYGGGWRQVRDYSGGMMTDWGAHHFDIAQWGLGADGWGPTEIHAPGSGPDFPKLTYIYESGVRVVHQGGGNGVLFIGTEGTVEVNRGYLKTNPEHLVHETFGPGEEQLYESRDHHANFLECIRTRQRPICDVAVGASTIRMCHLGNIAHWTGRSFHWDPKTRQITDDNDAARWLDRPRREPWHLA